MPRISHLNPVLAAVTLAVAVLAGPAGCSSTDEKGEELPDPDVAVVETNPDGVPYPTDRIGSARRRGTTPGDRMPNFTFRAYRDGDRTKGLETVSLAEYLDPEQRRHKVLHIQVAATWCAICSSVLEATVTVTEPLRQRGIVFLEIVVSGAVGGVGPSLLEVDDWMDRHKTNFTTAIDVRARRLSTLGINGTAMPHDILLDTRTMEILDSSVGAPVDIVRYTSEALAFVTKNPPSY